MKCAALAPKVKKQVLLESHSNSHLRKVLTDTLDAKHDKEKVCKYRSIIIAFIHFANFNLLFLILIVYMFPESRFKSDSSQVIYFTKIFREH